MKKITLFYLLFIGIQMQSQILDSTFGTNGGIVTNQISSNPIGDTATGGALQLDGKIVLVTSNKVIRINVDGTLDSTFHNYENLLIANDKLESIIIQSDGKIITAGRNSVYRINTDGTLDTNFGTNGVMQIQINGFNMYIKSIGLKSDGKIILGGYVSNGINNDFAISCLNIDGSLDTLFDTDGKATLDINNQNNEGRELAIQSDDKIIITGQWNDGTNYNFATARFNTNGSLDLTFGTSGVVTASLGSASRAYTVGVQNDGNIVISGVYAGNKLAIVRYTANGEFDTTFNTSGKLLTANNFSLSSSLSGVQSGKPHLICLSNGKILISGKSGSSFSLYQINNDGSFDTTFGTSGISTYNINGTDFSSFLILKPNGEIITGGTSDISTFPRVEVIQFSSNGIFDTEHYYNIVLSVDSIFDIIEQSTGKTIACGGDSLYSKNKLIRYNTDGSIDNTFGTNGVIDISSQFSMIAKQPDDKLLVNDLSNFVQSIIRYTSDGILDTSFGINGIVDFSTNTPVIVNFIDAITVSQNGKINVAFDYGTDGSSCGPTHFGVLRLNTDGTLDTSFGINGYSDIPFDFYSTIESEFPQSIYEDTDGKLIITGIIEPNTNTMGQVGTTRINNDGTIDQSFGTNGKVVTQIGIFNIGTAILKTPNNKYLINSYNLNSSPIVTTLIQYNYDGSIDTSFGSNGILTDQLHFFNSVILQPDGKILRAGNINNQFALYRNNAGGNMDTTFGTNGLLSTPIFYSSNINKLLFLQNGKLLACGYSFNGTNQLFAQARYTFDNLGTDSFAPKDTFTIYPNPANNKFSINFGSELKSINYQIKITNLLGQEVYSSFTKTITTAIPVTWVGKGIYFVTILNEKNDLIKTEKLIIE